MGAARARVLHVRAHGSPRRTPGPCSPAEPRPTLAHSPEPSKPPWRPTAPPSGVPWRHAGVGSRLCHGRRRPSHPRAPAAPWEQPEPIHKLVGTHSSLPRRPAATEQRSPAVLSTAAAGPISNAYIRGPRARPSTQATSFYPPSAPTPTNRRREAIFPDYGRFGRRRLPVPFVVTRASPHIQRHRPTPLGCAESPSL